MFHVLCVLLSFAEISAVRRTQNLRKCEGECLEPATNTIMEKVMPHKKVFFDQMRERLTESKNLYSKLGYSECVDDVAAGIYPCHKMDLLGFIPYADMRGENSRASQGNDIWGWTDPTTGREYALSGQYDQTAIVDVTDGNLVPLIAIPRARSSWSDIKVYQNYMFIGTEGGSGIQVFDLTRVRGQTGEKIVTMQPDTVYGAGVIRQSHNVVINEDTGFLYVVGSYSTCRGGLHIVDIREPAYPTYAGCFSADGYTHDAQCVVYKGPDVRYHDREICFNYNEDDLTIVDVTDKENIVMISRTSYKGVAYTHQGWLTEDQGYLLLDDELDERYGSVKNTHTYIWDVKDLEKPVHFSDYIGPVEAIDHNLYILNNLAYLSNYQSGLRVVDLSNIASGELKEVACFNVHPEDENGVQFVGSWSSYIYFPSGNIAINSIERGLFLVKLTK